jgi:hypothetical protein
MAENSGSGATPWLAFLVGGLLVVVAVIAYFVYSGGAPAPSKSVDVNIKAPEVSVPAKPG